jgi:uncharacterized protein YecE (DUF72 family)
MKTRHNYIIGTSGYSFLDWVGTFYPAGTQQKDMLDQYVRNFQAVEINFSFYRIPTAKTMEGIARKTPPGYRIWVKANQAVTHEGNLSVTPAFRDGIAPVVAAGKLAGVLFQWPQRFHRTIENRKFLAQAVADMKDLPLAVEFRHASWQHESVLAGLRERGITLVVPDVPDVPGLYRSPPAATTPTGYFRLHSRNAEKWYAPEGSDRYDYNYNHQELAEILQAWEGLDEPMDEVYTFFNNCHHGQAAQNAEALRKILEQV